MPNTALTEEILNDLVKINNDRIAGYERAIKETNSLDVDLKSIFEGMVHESTEYKTELAAKIKLHGGTVGTGTTAAGKIYRTWMDVKAKFTGSDRAAVLSSCEFGEDAAQRAYKAALDAEADLDAGTRSLILEQQQKLKASHDVIKTYRDAHAAA
jgi:uncharacterized protein (TIGR02284 family)